MKHHSIITGLILALFIAGFTFAQELLTGAAENLFKPMPVLENCKMPVFPELSSDSMAVQGRVIVMARVNDKGEVVSSTIMREAPKGFGFGDAVLAVIDDWNYLPAYWNGKPTTYSILETFYFKDGLVEYEARESASAVKDTTKNVNVKISQ